MPSVAKAPSPPRGAQSRLNADRSAHRGAALKMHHSGEAASLVNPSPPMLRTPPNVPKRCSHSGSCPRYGKDRRARSKPEASPAEVPMPRLQHGKSVCPWDLHQTQLDPRSLTPPGGARPRAGQLSGPSGAPGGAPLARSRAARRRTKAAGGQVSERRAAGGSFGQIKSLCRCWPSGSGRGLGSSVERMLRDLLPTPRGLFGPRAIYLCQHPFKLVFFYSSLDSFSF